MGCQKCPPKILDLFLCTTPSRSAFQCHSYRAAVSTNLTIKIDTSRVPADDCKRLLSKVNSVPPCFSYVDIDATFKVQLAGLTIRLRQVRSRRFRRVWCITSYGKQTVSRGSIRPCAQSPQRASKGGREPLRSKRRRYSDRLNSAGISVS